MALITSPKVFTILVGGVLALIVTFMSYTGTSTRPWPTSFLEAKTSSRPIQRIEPLLPTSRSGKPTLDIVISMYKEPLEQTGRMIHELKELAPFQGLDVHAYIYVKDLTADSKLIQEKTGATNVTILQNTGREAGTYFSHIVRHWDNLARHTMFIQADMHLYDEARNRVTDWFFPKTGFLSLGHYEECECVQCADTWDKDRFYPRIQELYSALNGELCPKKITITYLGQFLVSATRLRSRSLQTYQYLQSVLQSDNDHFIHSDPRQSDLFQDEKSNPYFGHTMERAWNVMWNCSDPELYKHCSGLDALSQRRTADQPDDTCQCVDS